MSLIEFFKYLLSMDSSPLLLIGLLMFIIYYKKVIKPDLTSIKDSVNDINLNMLDRNDIQDLVDFVNKLVDKLKVIEDIKSDINDINESMDKSLKILDAVSIGLVDTIKSIIESELTKILDTLNKVSDLETYINNILNNQEQLTGDVKKSTDVLIDLSNEILMIEEDVNNILNVLDSLINILGNNNNTLETDEEKYMLNVLLNNLVNSRDEISNKYDYLKNNLKRLYPNSRITQYKNKVKDQDSPKSRLKQFIDNNNKLKEK